jgi:ABC-type polar amino acid transport system ATPase subunit
MIDLKNVSVTFDSQHVLEGLNVSMKQSEFVWSARQEWGKARSCDCSILIYCQLPG